jgi:mannosyltransferase OCH1-like enzyme
MLNHFVNKKINKIQENKQKRFSKFYKNNKKIQKTLDINIIDDSYYLTYIHPKNKTLLFNNTIFIHFDDSLKYKQHVVMNINKIIPIHTDNDIVTDTPNHDNKIQTIQSIFDFQVFNHMYIKPIFLKTTYTDKPNFNNYTVKNKQNIVNLMQITQLNQKSYLKINAYNNPKHETNNVYNFQHQYSPITMNMDTSKMKLEHETNNIYGFQHQYSPITMNMDTSKMKPEHETNNIYGFQHQYSPITMNMDTSKMKPEHETNNVYDFQHQYSHITMNIDTSKMKKDHEPIHNIYDYQILKKSINMNFYKNNDSFNQLNGNSQIIDGNSQIIDGNSQIIDGNTDFRSIIPLNIFQTWHTLDIPPKMKQNVELLKTQNPEFTHYLYDDKMCRDFIQDNFNEDIVWAFDKLKPGAYKADLWRYCVLYIHGGIYLDIKFKCINHFKLIQLTDQEYWVKDISHVSSQINGKKINGIYQAFISCFPKNQILYKAIYTIVNNCFFDNYTNNNALAVTGPALIFKLNTNTEFNELKLENIGNLIIYKKNKLKILNCYKEYRFEQNKTQPINHYALLWKNINIFNYPTLLSQNTYNFTNTIKTKNITLYSGTPTIIQDPNNCNQYVINLRWINYNYNKNGSKQFIPPQWVSLNTRFTLDSHFEQISNEVFLNENIDIEHNVSGVGLEDIRIIKFNNKHFYLATRFNPILKRSYVCSNEYKINETEYNLNKTYINPTFYDVLKNRRAEKNWAMFEYKTKLSVVYDWYPLQIGCINYHSYELDIIETKTNMPEFFQNARGSTVGCHFNNEIWFVLHKSQNNRKLKSTNTIFNYQHFFAVFDLNMNIKRHSELFKFGDKMVEFCTGFIMEENRLILSYSLLDTLSYVSTYDYNTIHNYIKWYNY